MVNCCTLIRFACHFFLFGPLEHWGEETCFHMIHVIGFSIIPIIHFPVTFRCARYLLRFWCDYVPANLDVVVNKSNQLTNYFVISWNWRFLLAGKIRWRPERPSANTLTHIHTQTRKKERKSKSKSKWEGNVVSKLRNQPPSECRFVPCDFDASNVYTLYIPQMYECGCGCGCASELVSKRMRIRGKFLGNEDKIKWNHPLNYFLLLLLLILIDIIPLVLSHMRSSVK